MKVPFRDIKTFAHNPPSNIAVILVYGPDYGLMKERIETMAKKIVPDITDPFNVSDLDLEALDHPSQIIDEANTISMMGGKRLVRVRSGADKLTATLKEYLQAPNPDAVILIEAGEMTPRSTLRKLCETHKQAAALPCYVEEAQDLVSFISKTLQEYVYTIERDAQMWLADNLKGDHQRAKSELEKLMLYKGNLEGKHINLRDAMESSGLSGAQSMDDCIYAVADRNVKVALKSFETLLQDGLPSIAILRAIQNHFRRLLQVKNLMESGVSSAEALNTLTPPLFFKVKDKFCAHIREWSICNIYDTIRILSEIEGKSKTTGYDSDVLLGQFIAQLQMKNVA